MEIIINAEPKTCQAATLEALIGELGINTQKMAVEINGTIIPRSLYPHTALAQGDRIEMVRFIGGG